MDTYFYGMAKLAGDDRILTDVLEGILPPYLDLSIGPSGAGKTRGYVIPNILQCTGSMMITDPKGSLRQEVGPVLERNGYKVLEIDLADRLASPQGCNPMDYVRYDQRRDAFCEQDVMTIAACLVPLSSHGLP